MKGFVITLVAFMVIQEVMCQNDNQVLRKRKIRKKKIKTKVRTIHFRLILNLP